MIIFYLALWLFVLVRYLMYNYGSKSYNVNHAANLGAKAATFRKQGWVIFLFYPFLLITFPWVEIIEQDTQNEVTEWMVYEAEYFEIPLEEARLRHSFYVDKQLAFFFFKGEFLGFSKYIYNNTDSTLNIYYVKYDGFKPHYVDEVDCGVDILPGELIKFSEPIDNYFCKPIHSYGEFWSIDEKGFATMQKENYKRIIANNGRDPIFIEEESSEDSERVKGIAPELDLLHLYGTGTNYNKLP